MMSLHRYRSGMQYDEGHLIVHEEHWKSSELDNKI